MGFIKHTGIVLGLALIWLVYQRSFLLGDILLNMPSSDRIMATGIFTCAFGTTMAFLLLSNKERPCALQSRLNQGVLFIALLSIEIAYLSYLSINIAAPTLVIILAWFSLGAASISVLSKWLRFLVRSLFAKGPEYSFAVLFGALLLARLISFVSEASETNMTWVILCPAASLFLYIALADKEEQVEPTFDGKLTFSRNRTSIISLALMLVAMAILEFISDTYLIFSIRPNWFVFTNAVTLIFYIGGFILSVAQYRNENRSSNLRSVWFALFGCITGVFSGVLINNLTIDHYQTDQIQVAAWALAWAIDILLVLLLTYETMARPRFTFTLFFYLPQLADFNVKALRLSSNGTLLAPPIGTDHIEAIRGLATVIFIVALCAALYALSTSKAFSAFTKHGENEPRNPIADQEQNSNAKLEELCRQHVLTARESEVLRQLAMGKSAKTIAGTLYVSPETIRSHTKRIYAKLDIHSRDELMELLDRRGVITQLIQTSEQKD